MKGWQIQSCKQNDMISIMKFQRQPILSFLIKHVEAFRVYRVKDGSSLQLILGNIKLAFI